MNYLKIGKIITTHGIKGELKVISDFSLQDKVLTLGYIVYIGQDKERLVIKSVRKQPKNYLITFKDLDNINLVLKYKNQDIYIKRESLDIQDYLIEDLIGFKVREDNIYYGEVKDIYQNKTKVNNILLNINYKKDYYLPYNKEFIKNIDVKNKIIEVKRIGELL